MLGEDKTLTLQGVYNTLYNAATRPDFKFAVTRYFIDEWVPLLGPSLAWLVVGLRQQCFWNRRRDWCIVDKATLSRETALDERTIERCLKKPWSDWFVLEITHRYRYRSQIGKKVRDKNRYQLLLDEPLSPRHQLGLAALLRQVTPDQADPLAAGLAAVETILTMPHLTDKISFTGSIPKSLPRRTVLELVQETLAIKLADYAADERIVTLDQRCAQLHNQIVQPNKLYVGWQYFRLEWTPLLGHALAWIVIYLRRHCFWDEMTDELRDTFITYKKDLAAAVGQTTRNLANLMDNPYSPLFFTTADSDSGSASRNQPTLYQVRLVDEPLTPADQQRVAEALQQQLLGEAYGQDVESGQLNLFPMLDRLTGRQNFAYGQASEKMPESDRKNRRVEPQLTEKMTQHAGPANGKNDATLNDSLILTDRSQIQKQQKQAAVEIKRLEKLFQELAVQEPARSKLLTNPDLTVAHVGAWFLYAETQPSLFDPRSYVIKRLLANDPPPPQFVAFAGLDDATWRRFEEAGEALRLRQPPAVEIAPELHDIFVSWADVYVGLEPAETQALLDRSAQLRLKPAPAATSPEMDQPSPQPAHLAQTQAERLWQAALDQLRQQMPKQTFDSWLRQTEAVDYRDNVLIIDVKNAYAQDWLEHRLASAVEKAVANVAGKPATVRFILASPVSEP